MESHKAIYIYIYIFLLKQIQAKLKAQMVGIQVQFEKFVYVVLKCLISATWSHQLFTQIALWKDPGGCWLLILPSSCYTITFKLVTRIWC